METIPVCSLCGLETLKDVFEFSSPFNQKVHCCQMCWNKPLLDALMKGLKDKGRQIECDCCPDCGEKLNLKQDE